MTTINNNRYKAEVLYNSMPKAVKVTWKVLVENHRKGTEYEKYVETWWRIQKEKFDATLEAIELSFSRSEKLIMTLDYHISDADMAVIDDLCIKLPMKAK